MITLSQHVIQNCPTKLPNPSRKKKKKNSSPLSQFQQTGGFRPRSLPGPPPGRRPRSSWSASAAPAALPFSRTRGPRGRPGRQQLHVVDQKPMGFWDVNWSSQKLFRTRKLKLICILMHMIQHIIHPLAYSYKYMQIWYVYSFRRCQPVEVNTFDNTSIGIKLVINKSHLRVTLDKPKPCAPKPEMEPDSAEILDLRPWAVGVVTT